ncbi:tail fiber protein [Buttiauxella sp. S04-F03]|uniref:tail fiber protein n=1 Tax=Buttiauxella sp. S04-F03 TaxID=2904525 RepID=UPI001E45B3EC|nr:tail fiber protein [Buttiauxella sp. S04-F03]MCE0812951.1 tail fiber protein [Buttiauxella sp. S04-F03]
MTVKYKTLITTAGAAKFAAATAGGTKITITQMAVGDGGGTLPVPDVAQTKLIREKWRAALNKISVDAKKKNYVIAELVIPPEVGGFWLREMGLYDADGTLVAVANMAESYKPELAEGSGRAQTLRMVIIVSAVESVDLVIDTTMVMATQDYVDDKIAEHEQSRRHPDASLTAKGLTQLSSATDSASEVLAATPKAVKAAYDLANGKYTALDATTARKGLVQLSSATDSTSEVLAATPKAVKAAYDLANGKYTALDATTTRKGLVQLSSATDSTSEVLAATPKAVKTAFDLANGKYSAQDASTARKGIVQLSSATDSTSEVLAATPKAVKAANDNANGRVPSTRKINGRALSADVNVTSQDIFNGQAIGLTADIDLNTLTTPGLYYNPANANATPAKNYPSTNAGSLMVLKDAGCTQIYTEYNSGRQYRRGFYTGVWTAWFGVFDTRFKPSAGDVGALPLNGGTINGSVTVNNSITVNENVWAKSAVYVGDSDSGLHSNGDGGCAFWANNKSVGYWNTSNLYWTAGQIIPSNYANFDLKYQPKGSYTPAGEAYTKAQSDARYGVVNGIRRGGQQHKVGGDWIKAWEAPAGCIMTGLNTDEGNDGRKMGIYYRQLQYLNRQTGAWVNIGD